MLTISTSEHTFTKRFSSSFQRENQKYNKVLEILTTLKVNIFCYLIKNINCRNGKQINGHLSCFFM